jgi:hypothetical protein
METMYVVIKGVAIVVALVGFCYIISYVSPKSNNKTIRTGRKTA